MQNKVTRKVHISEKKGKNVGSLSYFQRKEKKNMVNKNTIIHVPYFLPLLLKKNQVKMCSLYYRDKLLFRKLSFWVWL
jgi:hypothetical protein